MKKKDLQYFVILNGTWLVLLIEYLVLKLDLALPLAIMWGIGTIIFDLRIFWKSAITVTYEN